MGLIPVADELVSHDDLEDEDALGAKTPARVESPVPGPVSTNPIEQIVGSYGEQ